MFPSTEWAGLSLAAILGYRARVSFFSAMFEEMWERRQRFQKAVGKSTGGLIEFVIFSGVLVSIGAILLGNMLGALPLLGLVAGYPILDQRRQAALARGADPEAVRKRADMHALIFFGAIAVLGFWVFGQAMGAKQAEGWVEPPPEVLNLEITKE